MLTTLWNRTTHSGSSSSLCTRSSNEVQSTLVSTPSLTPFTDFVLSRIPDEETQKLFALSSGEYLKRDPNAQNIDFDDVHRWLGIPLKANAVRVLKRELDQSEYLVIHKDENSGGCPRDIYLISFDQFEQLMTAAQTGDGKKARKLVLSSNSFEPVPWPSRQLKHPERLQEQTHYRSNWMAFEHSSSTCTASSSSVTATSAVSVLT